MVTYYKLNDQTNEDYRIPRNTNICMVRYAYSYLKGTIFKSNHT